VIGAPTDSPGVVAVVVVMALLLLVVIGTAVMPFLGRRKGKPPEPEPSEKRDDET
jgi:hypothetical protein